ncbi:L,D-transpeptidase family protein [Streptomyces sp. TRM68416]|uniref:L,D-transpeptidase family protein n=1 Tax=Streptomyces sp. TRM68416 TaxID=2758412 RepID=UPI00397F74FA
MTTVLLTAVLLPLTAVGAGIARAAPAAPDCQAGTGPYQREMERHLRLRVDGRQSPADCEAIRDFQSRNRLTPADGYANLATYRTMLVVEARPDPNKAGNCPVRSYRTACVDLTRQLMWVQDGRRVVYAPVPIRSGRDGYETRAGWHSVYWRNIDHYSTLYDNAPMPYSQFFSDGQAFHGVHHDLFSGGSHGCVNLRLDDARRLWNTLRLHDAVYVWGTKPGTWRTPPVTAPESPDPAPAGRTPPQNHDAP